MASPGLLAVATQRLSSGSWYEAEAAAHAAISHDPDDVGAALVLGLAIAAMGENLRAATILNHIATVRPDAEHPCAGLVRLGPPLPRALVARQFRACLRLVPSDDRLRLELADFLLGIGHVAEVEAILLDGPDNAACYHRMGLARAEQNQFPSAIASFQRAVALNPQAVASWSNLGVVLKVEDRFPLSIAAHDKAVALSPRDPRFRVNRAVTLLRAGEWERAWPDYEARFDLTDTPLIDPARLLPSLGPTDNLTGLTILALHEEGFGDTLQFLRYLLLLVERGARVVVYLSPPLARIMRAVPGVAEVVTDRRSIPAHDFVYPTPRPASGVRHNGANRPAGTVGDDGPGAGTPLAGAAPDCGAADWSGPDRRGPRFRGS